MKRRYYRWHSSHLGRDMELLSFGSRGANVLVFPTRVGRFYDYENWGLVESLREKIEGGRLRLLCLDSIDEESLYCDWNHPADRVKRHLEYERYILEEVVPVALDSNPDPALVAHGCSLGAYHAVNLAFRHPRLFSKVAGFSGRYDLTVNTGSHRDLFDGYYDDDIYFHTPTHFLPNMEDESILAALRSMEIILTVGEEDAFLSNNRALSEILDRLEIPHQLYVWTEEAHRARYWRRMARLYL